MSRIRIEIPINLPKEKEKSLHKIAQIEKFFSNQSFAWEFFGIETNFVSSTKVSKYKGNNYKHELQENIELMKVFPDNNMLKEQHIEILKRIKNDWQYNISIIISGEICSEIDIKNNTIIYYEGPIKKDIKHRDIYKIKNFIKYDYLEDFYCDYLYDFLICVVMSFMITAPFINMACIPIELSFDNIIYIKKLFITYPRQNEAYFCYKDIFVTKLTFDKVFLWIKTNTDLLDLDKKSPVAFSALSYIFYRNDYESLLYSIIGLESIFSAKGKSISKILQKRIQFLFPFVTSDQIDKMYKLRSRYVHGNIQIVNCNRLNDFCNDGYECYEDRDIPILATALLIESIRKMIYNDATKICFDVYESYRYC
ncbi:MAG: hypothetical protein IJF98_01775 [Firmicutes bacterium]|nr:hypothetical protein [Bacillota bacterium]